MEKPCDYHQEMMNTLAECREELARVEERSEGSKTDIEALFNYLKELTKGQQGIALTIQEVSIRAKERSDKVDELCEKVDAHFEEYDYIIKEVTDFKWFRTILNNPKVQLAILIFLVLVAVDMVTNPKTVKAITWLVEKM